jgi:hypothetical protein
MHVHSPSAKSLLFFAKMELCFSKRCRNVVRWVIKGAQGLSGRQAGCMYDDGYGLGVLGLGLRRYGWMSRRTH